MSRTPGERNWEDPTGYTLHLADVPTQQPHKHRRFAVTDNGAGQFSVTSSGFEWIVYRGADGELEIIETDCPTKDHDLRVLRAVQEQY